MAAGKFYLNGVYGEHPFYEGIKIENDGEVEFKGSYDEGRIWIRVYKRKGY